MEAQIGEIYQKKNSNDRLTRIKITRITDARVYYLALVNPYREFSMDYKSFEYFEPIK